MPKPNDNLYEILLAEAHMQWADDREALKAKTNELEDLRWDFIFVNREQRIANEALRVGTRDALLDMFQNALDKRERAWLRTKRKRS